jgi:CheY-like chemotaxis protein
MDVHMPDMDGFEATAHIKQMTGCKDIPIIFVTAVYKEDLYVRQGYAAGGIDYFGKPYDPDILRTKVAIYASFRQKENLLKDRERQIRESEELLGVGRQLSSALVSLPIGMLVTDLEGRICQMTDAVSRILKSADVTERPAYGEIPRWWKAGEHMIQDKQVALAAALNAGRPTQGKPTAILCSDGTQKTILVSTCPLRGLDGEITGAVLLIQDHTETRRIEVDLEHRVAHLVGLGADFDKGFPR